MLDRLFNAPPIIGVGKPDNALFQLLLPRRPFREFFPVVKIFQVSRQDQESLNQGNGQCQGDDDRQLTGHLGIFTGHKEPGGKGNHGGQHRKKYGFTDNHRTFNCALGTAAHAMRLLVNTLPHNNRIIDHDPQHQQECKGRHDVQ